MRFLCLYKPGKPELPPTQQEMDGMGKLIEEAMNAGWLLRPKGVYRALPARASGSWTESLL